MSNLSEIRNAYRKSIAVKTDKIESEVSDPSDLHIPKEVMDIRKEYEEMMEKEKEETKKEEEQK